MGLVNRDPSPPQFGEREPGNLGWWCTLGDVTGAGSRVSGACHQCRRGMALPTTSRAHILMGRGLLSKTGSRQKRTKVERNIGVVLRCGLVGGDLQSGQETGQGSFILTFIASSIPASNCWSTRGVYMYWNARN